MQLLSYKFGARCCLRPRFTAGKSAGKAVGNLLSKYIPLMNPGLHRQFGTGSEIRRATLVACKRQVRIEDENPFSVTYL